MSAVQRWKAVIDAEHAQSDRMRGSTPPADHWQTYAQGFRADPRRTDDPLVNRLRQEVTPQHTVIDVGAGGGRLALPLALQCRRVVAVEPSPSMADVLLEQAAAYGIRNISLVQARWEEAEAEPADLVLCAHVLYTVRDIAPFVRRLEAHARERVLVALYTTPPQAQIYPLWKRVHGEERLPLPSLPEFEAALEELGIGARVEILEPQLPRGFDSPEDALEQLGRRLYLTPGTPKRAFLERILPDVIAESNGVFQLRGVAPLRTGLVSWRPGPHSKPAEADDRVADGQQDKDQRRNGQ